MFFPKHDKTEIPHERESPMKTVAQAEEELRRRDPDEIQEESEDETYEVIFGETCFAEYIEDREDDQDWEIKKYGDADWSFFLQRKIDVVEMIKRLDKFAIRP